MKKRGKAKRRRGRRRIEGQVREGRPVTKLVEEIEGKEMQKETEVERLAGRSVEGRNRKWGFLHEPLSIREFDLDNFQILDISAVALNR